MSRSRRALFFFLMGIGALHAKGYTCDADTSTAIATDRPQVTNSSVVVPCGSLQLENGFQQTGSGGQRSLDLPETSLRVGIGGKGELRVGIPEYFSHSASSAGFANGFGDLSFGFKEQLGPRFGGFDVSVIPAVSIPTGAKLISSHGYDPTVQLPWSHGFAKLWTAAGMFSLMWPTETGRRNLTGQSSLYLDRQLLPLDIYLEYSGAFPQHGGPQHSIDFGVCYKPSVHQQLDLHGGFGLSSSTPDYSIGLGYSVRFQTMRSR